MNWGLILFIAGSAVCVLLILIVAIRNRKHLGKEADEKFIGNLMCKKDCRECGEDGCEEFKKSVMTEKRNAGECLYITEKNKELIKDFYNKKNSCDYSKVAVVCCKGGTECEDLVRYTGERTCRDIADTCVSLKKCPNACQGCGDCVKVCPAGAIEINQRGVAEVDSLKCIGCEECVKACPLNLIKMVPSVQEVAVICSNCESSDVCKVGCLACGECVANCPTGAISIVNGVPQVDESKCIKCMACVRICKNHTISRI